MLAITHDCRSAGKFFFAMTSVGPRCRRGLRSSPRPVSMTFARIGLRCQHHIPQVGLSARVLSGRNDLHKCVTSQHASQHDCRLFLRKTAETEMLRSGGSRSDAGWQKDAEAGPWETRGLPDNETHSLVRTTVKRNTVCRTMKHVLRLCYRTTKHLFRSQVPETTGESHPLICYLNR